MTGKSIMAYPAVTQGLMKNLMGATQSLITGSSPGPGLPQLERGSRGTACSF